MGLDPERWSRGAGPEWWGAGVAGCRGVGVDQGWTQSGGEGGRSGLDLEWRGWVEVEQG